MAAIFSSSTQEFKMINILFPSANQIYLVSKGDWSSSLKYIPNTEVVYHCIRSTTTKTRRKNVT